MDLVLNSSVVFVRRGRRNGPSPTIHVDAGEVTVVRRIDIICARRWASLDLCVWYVCVGRAGGMNEGVCVCCVTKALRFGSAKGGSGLATRVETAISLPLLTRQTYLSLVSHGKEEARRAFIYGMVEGEDRRDYDASGPWVIPKWAGKGLTT